MSQLNVHLSILMYIGTWDHMGGSNFGPRFKRVETRGCDLYLDGVLDLHEALFGPLPDLRPDDKEGQVKRQEELIRSPSCLGCGRDGLRDLYKG